MTTVYDAAGGSQTFRRLVDRFYEGVAADPLLRPMYPGDLEPARERLRMFLEQYWGGPATYSRQRGHPMLRRRHLEFPIGRAAREAWLTHMQVAVRELEVPEDVRTALIEHFDAASRAMMNLPG